MIWEELKEIALKQGFIDNGDEIEKHFDGGYICFLKDGRIVLNKTCSDFDEMEKIIKEVKKCQK